MARGASVWPASGRDTMNRHALGVAGWLLVYAGLILTPVFVLLLPPRPPGLGFWWDLSLGLGCAAATMMAVQFVLTARFRRASAPYGIDVILYFHRYLAIVAAMFVAGHVGLVLWENPAVAEFLNPLTAPWHMRAGLASTVAVAALLLTSLARRALRVEYDRWRWLHAALAVVAVGAAFAHLHGAAYYTATPAARLVWASIAVSWLAIILYVRAVRPWFVTRRPYRVASVTPERGDAWSLRLTPDGHAGLRFTAGQFVWLSLRASPFAMREHPFSISSAPSADGALTLTIKALGDFTATIGATAPGEVAFVDGPYGAFTLDRREAHGYVFVAGGIGIAPMMSLLRALADRRETRPIVLFYAYRRWDRMTFREEIEQFKDRLPLTFVPILEEPPEGWTGEAGRLTHDVLARHLPTDRDALECFICGPMPMIAAAERALHALGVPLARLHSEIFDLA
jgi:predicted ferric reductase